MAAPAKRDQMIAPRDIIGKFTGTAADALITWPAS